MNVSSSPLLPADSPSGAVANLARQPIFDKKLTTVGYQLLYRLDDAADARAGDPMCVTSTILSNVLAEFGLETVVGQLPAWVTFPSAYLVEGLPIPLGPKALVVSLADDSALSEELLERLTALRKQGYRIAGNARQLLSEPERLGKIVSIARLDIHGQGDEALGLTVKSLLKMGATVLANRVETMTEYQSCEKLGVSLFEGYFVCRPEVIRQRRVPTNRLTMIQLLSELYNESPNIERVRQLVQQDVTLSYRLIKWLNSSLFALPRPVDSIQHALVMLGLNRLRNLVSLIVLSRIDDKPSELVTISLMRARIGERIAPHYKLSPDAMFTVGMFSLLDVLIGVPMDQVLETMPLTPELRGAILNREGVAGRLLLAIEAHERGDWEAIERNGLDLSVLTPAWVDAAVWVRQIRGLTRSSPGLGGGAMRV